MGALQAAAMETGAERRFAKQKGLGGMGTTRYLPGKHGVQDVVQMK